MGRMIWTIGHSSRPLAVFIGLLTAARIQQVADVRRFAGSRAFPWFGAEPLAASLAEAGIGYLACAGLGGRRRARPGSRNTVWRNASFRAYADFMETPAFAQNLDRLERQAGRCRTAIMCAEAVWWRCHRALIADALKARGWQVLHILDGRTAEHPYTSAASLVDGKLEYGAAP